MADFSTPFGENSGRRLPNADERANGFPCGPADQTLFNGLFNRIESEMGEVISHAGLTPTDTRFTQLREAIVALINAATGGGETTDYLLLSQAKSRLPIFPEIQSSDGKMNVTSPATGTVRLPGNVTFIHRGVDPISTVETDFPTTISRTYHLRWSIANGYELKDLTDAGYNPSFLPEDDSAFDSTYDDMLIARVVTNSSNVATITNLVNKHRLSINQHITGADAQLSGQNGANFKFENTYNWARRPDNYNMTIWRVEASGLTDYDINFTSVNTTPRNTPLNGEPTTVDVNRYRVGSVVMYDFATGLECKFNGAA